MKIAAGVFKAKCLSFMDTVEQTHQEIIITKHGKAVAKLVPAESGPVAVFGRMKDSAVVVGDIISPIDEKWDACEQG